MYIAKIKTVSRDHPGFQVCIGSAVSGRIVIQPGRCFHIIKLIPDGVEIDPLGHSLIHHIQKPGMFLIVKPGRTAGPVKGVEDRHHSLGFTGFTNG